MTTAQKDLYSPADLAEWFGGDVSERKVIDWVRLYSWPHVRVGRMVRFTPEHRQLILAKHSSLPARSPAAVAISGQTPRSRAAAARKRRAS